jgi:hypothetical protein
LQVLNSLYVRVNNSLRMLIKTKQPNLSDGVSLTNLHRYLHKGEATANCSPRVKCEEFVPVVQWIEWGTANPLMKVRVHPGTLSFNKVR